MIPYSVHAYVCMCLHVPIYCVKVRGQTQTLSLRYYLPLLKAEFLTDLEFPKLDFLLREPSTSACLYLPRAGIVSM